MSKRKDGSRKRVSSSRRQFSRRALLSSVGAGLALTAAGSTKKLDLAMATPGDACEIKGGRCKIVDLSSGSIDFDKTTMEVNLSGGSIQFRCRKPPTKTP